MTLQLKKEISLVKIKNVFKKGHNIALYQHSSINPLDYSDIKGYGESNELKILQVKNSLVRKALQDTEFVQFSNIFEGPSVVVYTSNNKALSTLCSLHKRFPKLSPIGAVVDNSLVSASQFDFFSKLQNINDFKASIASILVENVHYISTLTMSSIFELSVKTKDI